MDKRITKFRLFTVVDFMEEEKWLEDQYKKGLRLVKIHLPGFYVFEESKAEDVVYKLEYKDDTVKEDYIQMYKDYGWEYVLTFAKWNYFRKNVSALTDEREKDIFSDDQSKFNMIKRMFISVMIPFLSAFFMILIPNIIKIVRKERGTFETVLGLFYLTLLVLYCFLFIYFTYKMIKFWKQLKRK